MSSASRRKKERIRVQWFGVRVEENCWFPGKGGVCALAAVIFKVQLFGVGR